MAECTVEAKPRPKPKPRTKPVTDPLEQRTNESDHRASVDALGRQKGSHVVSSESSSGISLIEALLSHNKQLDDSLTKCDSKIREQQSILEELQQQLTELQTQESTLDDEMKALSTGQSENEQEVEKYLGIYERLKSDEKLFKAACNDELDRLQKELESFDADFPDASKADLVAQLERSQARLEAGRIELGTINRKVAALKRQIEQVPNRMELREYRLRFSELYNQVSATHRSTKQFFSLYNSLEDTKRYLEKELSLLNSIVDSYQLACATASGREDFLRQLQSINEGMRDTCSKVDKRYQTDKALVDTLHGEIQRLLDVKVGYEKCLLELEAECRRNDLLLAECKAVEVKSTVQNHSSSTSGDSDND